MFKAINIPSCNNVILGDAVSFITTTTTTNNEKKTLLRKIYKKLMYSSPYQSNFYRSFEGKISVTLVSFLYIDKFFLLYYYIVVQCNVFPVQSARYICNSSWCSYIFWFSRFYVSFFFSWKCCKNFTLKLNKQNFNDGKCLFIANLLGHFHATMVVYMELGGQCH